VQGDARSRHVADSWQLPLLAVYAARKAAELGANTFQIFSASPRMWRAKPPDADQVRLLRAARDRFDLYPLVIHVNYLINLASLDPVIRAKSIAAFRGELERARIIGAEFLVLHPGSFRGSCTEEGIAAFVLGLRDAAKDLDTGKVMVLLENTVGAGCHLGSRFEELREIRDLSAELTDLPIGYCLDTCHLFAAGFNIATQAGLRDTLRAFDIANVHVIHANDSRAPLGSRIDRHANIGEGHIGREAFRRILTHPKLRSKPFILETPVEEEGDDRRNLDTLKELAVKLK
jgi:deoxyribonuclease-4